jgi:hypothetical protein
MEASSAPYVHIGIADMGYILPYELIWFEVRMAKWGPKVLQMRIDRLYWRYGVLP